MMYDRNTIVSVSETYFHSFHDSYEDKHDKIYFFQKHNALLTFVKLDLESRLLSYCVLIYRSWSLRDLCLILDLGEDLGEKGE